MTGCFQRTKQIQTFASSKRRGLKFTEDKKERHHTELIGRLRAAVLGANDGMLSTSSLVLGVAATSATHRSVMVAGAMSMQAGEYVSVHSQADSEDADLALERTELRTNDKGGHKELSAIYLDRGLNPAIAQQVAEQLMAQDALGACSRRTRHRRQVSCASNPGFIGISR